MAQLLSRITELTTRGTQRVMATRLIRTLLRFGEHRGPLQAAGLAYQALFALFAGLWLIFSIGGLVLGRDDELAAPVIRAVGRAVPGLISTAGVPGAIDPEQLLTASATFSITGVIALVGLLFTAIGFLGSARDAVRSMFDLPPIPGLILPRVADLLFLIGFLVVAVLSAVLTVVGTAATGFLLSLVGVQEAAPLALVAGRVVAIGVVVLIDAFIVGCMLRVLARVRIPAARLRAAALAGGVAAAALTIAFQLGVIGGAGANPLVASFIAILGLLVFFQFLCLALLLVSAWTALRLEDAGIVVDEAAVAARLERARLLVSGAATDAVPIGRGGAVGGDA